jgi:predicted dehydrogenase
MPVNVLVVGGGSIGERHLRCFQQIGCSVAICESLDARRVALCEQYHIKLAFASPQEAAAHAIRTVPWDGVVIATPAHLHVEHAELLAPATAALLIEKPLCTSLADVPRLQSIAATRLVQIAYVLRAHPATQHVRQLLASGTIGTVHQVTVHAGQNFPTFRPAYREIYYADRARGGGAIQDAATHWIDLIQYLAGPMAWVACDAAHQALAGVEVEDTVHLFGRTASPPVQVSLTLNQFQAPNESHLQLNGENGSLAIELHRNRAGLFLHGDAEWTWTEPLISERDDLFRAQAQGFLSATVGSEPPLCSLDEGIGALRTTLAALQSTNESRRITIESSNG